LNSQKLHAVSIVDRMNRDWVFRVLLWTFGVVLFVFALVPVLHSIHGTGIKDYFVWHETGQTILRGAELYPDPRFNKFPFMYPPPCALLLAPISALGQTGMIVVLVLINAAAWICSIIFSIFLATGRRQLPHVLLYLVPSLVVGAYVWGNFLLGQPSLLLLALLLGAFICLRQKLQIGAGLLIAFAAAIKVFPVAAMVYLIYRRQWIATATLVFTLFVLVVLAPIPFRGYSLAKEELNKYATGTLLSYDESGMGQRRGRSHSWKNQSIWGVANRLLRHVEYDHRHGPHTPVYVNFVDLKFQTVNGIILGLVLLLGGIFIAVMPRSDFRTQETDAIEFALLMLLILIFTPLTFGYLFVWLLYPLTVIVHRVLSAPEASRRLLCFTVAAVVLLSLSIPLRIPAQAYGNTLLATLLLFIGLAMELWDLKRAGVDRALRAR
jgi:hypothetical protein